MEEIWVDVKGFEGKYRISNLGSVKFSGTKHHILDKNGRSVAINKSARILKSQINKQGYVVFSLYLNGKQIKVKQHRLICLHFLPNPENKTSINHINGVKSDNALNNLEWCTASENGLHTFRTGLNRISEKHKVQLSDRMKCKTGSKSHQSKKIIDLRTNRVYVSISEASSDLGIKMKTLSAQLNGQNRNSTSLKFI